MDRQTKIDNNMIYIKIIACFILISSCKQQSAEKNDTNRNKQLLETSVVNKVTSEENRIMNEEELFDLQEKALNGQKAAIFSLYNYYIYGSQDYERAFYWGYLHDKIDKSQNLAQLAEDNIKSNISEKYIKQDHGEEVDDDEIPDVK